MTKLGNSKNQINLGWFVMGNTSYRFHFQGNVCGNTGGQFAFVLTIREINEGKYLDDILFSRTGLSLSYLYIFKPTSINRVYSENIARIIRFFLFDK